MDRPGLDGLGVLPFESVAAQALKDTIAECKRLEEYFRYFYFTAPPCHRPRGGDDGFANVFRRFRDFFGQRWHENFFRGRRSRRCGRF